MVDICPEEEEEGWVDGNSDLGRLLKTMTKHHIIIIDEVERLEKKVDSILERLERLAPN